MAGVRALKISRARQARALCMRRARQARAADRHKEQGVLPAPNRLPLSPLASVADSAADESASDESASDESAALQLDFANNQLLPALFGGGAAHLRLLEEGLGIRIAQRGNRLHVRGAPPACAQARRILAALYARLQAGESVTSADVKAQLQFAAPQSDDDAEAAEDMKDDADQPAPTIKLARRDIRPLTPRQRLYLQALQEKPLVFGLGPAGTGKTFLAVAAAVQALLAGRCERIILCRPALEAGERLGFLPGDMREKIDPYLRPLYDALYDMLPPAQVARRLAAGQIEIAPLAFMRGRTLSHAFIILDEAQNVTASQMKMCLTRLGEGSRMAVAGDASQVDLPPGARAGLPESLEILRAIPDIAFVRFDERDIVRHDLVAKIVRAYNVWTHEKQG